jgi:hypothetical protein
VNLAVSDHALLRFLERAAGMNIDELRGKLNDSLARAHTAARSLSDCDYLIKADGLIYVVRGDTVTTIVGDKAPVGRASTLEQRRQ